MRKHFLLFLGFTIFLILGFMSCEKKALYKTAPTANFGTQKNKYPMNTDIAFTDSSVAFEGSNLVSWKWNFGIADIPNSTEKNPLVKYPASGAYTVTLTVTDNNGLANQFSKNIIVFDPALRIQLAWQGQLGGTIGNSVSPAISPDEKQVYMIADQLNATTHDVILKAFNTSTGALVWEFNMTNAIASINQNGFATAVLCSPSVAANGDVYLAIRDLQPASTGTNRQSYVFCISSTGLQKWHYTYPFSGASANLNYFSPAIDASGLVYVGYLINATNPGGIVALNPADGTVNKTITMPNNGIRGGFALTKAGNLVCNASATPFGVNIYDCSSSTITTSGTVSTTTAQNGNYAIGADNTIYGVISNTVKSFTADGTVKWTYTGTISGTFFGGVIISADGSTIYVSGGTATAGNAQSGGIIAINTVDGTQKWYFGTSEHVSNCTPLLDSDGNIHFFTDNATYYIVSSTGTLIESKSMGVKTYSSPVMDATGRIYIGIENPIGTSYLLGIDCFASGHANSAWPMRGQNPQRTGLQK